MPASKLPTREHIFHEITRSLCPECLRVIDAQVLLRDGKVYLRKHCPEHGWTEALVMSDAQWYLDSRPYNKPGAIPHGFTTEVEQGCPFDCGLCAEHQQHTCVGLIEITTRCDLNCPTCFADAQPGYDLTLPQVEAMLDRFVEAEGRPEVVQISGGEPTLHPNLGGIIAAAKARSIRHIMLNTNGLRLASDAAFVHQLAEYQPTVYLQFDGLRPSADEILRGGDLVEIKRQALDNLHEAGLYAVLVATVARGVNESEIGDILRFGLEHPAVLGASFQPVTYAGRCLTHNDPLDRVTLTEVLHEVESQTDGAFRVDDFRPVPCPYPTCAASTYAFQEGEKITPLPRIVEVDDYLDFVTNRTFPDLAEELQPVLESLWSMAAMMGSDDTTGNLSCAACGINISVDFDLNKAKEHFFGVHVHGFMDAHTFDVKRLMKCCVHQLLPDGRVVPFCAYNTLHYRRQVLDAQAAE